MGFLLAMSFVLAGLGTPTQAVIRREAPVASQELSIAQPIVQKQVSGGFTQSVLVPVTSTHEFSLVGVTWMGQLDPTTVFKVRALEGSVWSPWTALSNSPDHGADPTSQEALSARSGTDPLMTGNSTGIQVIMLSKSRTIPTDVKVTLVNSAVTASDRAIVARVRQNALTTSGSPATSPKGAVVARPVIVSRAEWGANESWRDAHMKYGTKIIAGFIHHTAGIADYTPEQSAGIMRDLYYYYTHTKGYADLAYNFLVDKYGTIYEGRAGCDYGVVCDGPTVPVIGAHTAGMNSNTFAVSVMGNFETTPISSATASLIVDSVAQIMAWKIAPYGLDPNATAKIPSTDTSGLSKYPNGTFALTPVISAHRDVGKTACPGKYLYPYVSSIRAKISTLLIPVLQKVTITPTVLDDSSVAPITVSAVLPANATWTVDVLSGQDGSLVSTASALQLNAGRLTYAWNRTDSSGAVVPAGRYAIVISASVGTTDLPPRSSMVTVSEKPHPVDQITFRKRDASRTVVAWTQSPEEVLPLTAKVFRFSQDHGKTWTSWKKTAKLANYFVAVGWHKGISYTVQIRLVNALGYSDVVTQIYKPRK